MGNGSSSSRGVETSPSTVKPIESGALPVSCVNTEGEDGDVIQEFVL